MTSSPSDWGRVKSILADALERPVEKRGAFLDAACGTDLALRREVEALLLAEREEWSFFDSPPPGWPAPADSSPSSAREGTRVGPYEILRELGHGGMGQVYLGRRADDAFQKKVAIKLIRPGMAGEETLARFRTERQISAALEHPNIARLLDGGTTDSGEPYFVMEYVEGENLLDFCAGRRLRLEERLRLFGTICAAVEYAHRNLVVHRDIKPSNILVAEDGTPKLLDFGIAKLLEPDGGVGDRTATVMRVLTPDYASPEQVRGGAITTATDVYSLGIVLYQLLSGRRPYHVESGEVGELLRVVCERDPERPSAAAADPALARRLRGDLDTIVMKALRKEPRSRYGSVGELSDDIRRHLEARPVRARRGTQGYRAAKFVRRHRVGLLFAFVVVLALGAGVAATLREARRARLAEARAQRRFEDVRRMANAFLVEFHDAIRDLPGSTAARQLLVRRGLEYLDGLSSEAGDDPSLLRELSEGYRRLGELQGSVSLGSAMLGDMAGARKSYEKAIALLERLSRTKNAVPADRLALATLYARMSESLGRDGASELAAAYDRKAVALCEAEVATAPSDSEAGTRLASALVGLGNSLRFLEKRDEARVVFERAAKEWNRLAAADPSSVRLRRGVFVANYKIGALLAEGDQNEKATEAFTRAVEMAESLSRGDPSNGQYRRDLAIALLSLGESRLGAGDAAGAEADCRRAVAMLGALAAAEPASVNPRIWLAASHRVAGKSLVAEGKTAEGRGELDEAVSLLGPIAASTPRDVSATEQLAETCKAYGGGFGTVRRGDVLAARSWYLRAQHEYSALRDEGKLDPAHLRLLEEVDRRITDCDLALSR
ncbi:MAG TPA: protein kinase [Thermoanaerobaculia bacterium]